MEMQIKRTIEKIPGGMMLVPLFLGALCHTFSPDAGKYFGSFTNGMITGTVPILAVWFFCMGASIKLSATGTVLRKSGTLVVTKIAVAWVVAAIASRIIPEHGVEAGFFAGLSTLALVAAMDMTNGGLYASIMQQYGTKEEAGAFVLMSLESGPLMTMIILGTAGIASFEPHVFVGAVLPFLVGFTLGNLDPELREFFSKAVQTLIPFFAFALGNTIDLSVIAQTGLLGILLGVAVIIVTGIPLIIADKLIGGGRLLLDVAHVGQRLDHVVGGTVLDDLGRVNDIVEVRFGAHRRLVQFESAEAGRRGAHDQQQQYDEQRVANAMGCPGDRACV